MLKLPYLENPFIQASCSHAPRSHPHKGLDFREQQRPVVWQPWTGTSSGFHVEPVVPEACLGGVLLLLSQFSRVRLCVTP